MSAADSHRLHFSAERPWSGRAPAGFRLRRKPVPPGWVSAGGRNRLEVTGAAPASDCQGRCSGRRSDGV